MAQIVETIDRTAPETKPDLAAAVGISEQYLSELLQKLKREDIVRKGYVVDESELHANVETVSLLVSGGGAETAHSDRRSQELLERLERLDDVSYAQYEAAKTAFLGDETDEKAGHLEGLANRRHATIFEELKSYTLETEWPGNRVASDLATMATNLEIVGDRACFITDVVEKQPATATGAIEDRLVDIFEAGEEIHADLRQILFAGETAQYADLRNTEETVHRDLNELFELVTTYDPEMYGYLVTITRALERTLFYWVHTAELAIRLHSGRDPEHVTM